MLTDECEQLLLSPGAVAAGLGKPGGDDDEGANAGSERFLGGREHLLSRDADDCKVDRVADV